MNIYLIITNDSGYDTYDSGVVIAEHKAQATVLWRERTHGASIKSMEKIGTAELGAEPRVVCASFHAG